jgi:N-acetylneuraminate synthase
MKKIRYGQRWVGDGEPAWIVAEIGGNFTDFPTAKKLVDLAIDAGVDAVKIQTFQADTIATRKAVYDMPNTGRANQYDLFKKYEPGHDLQRQVWDYCRAKKIFIFSTPSHMKDVELLETLGAEIYKIGSDDAWNIPFLREVAALGKPMILATGMCTMDEVRESVAAILERGNGNLALLHCVTNYPADPAHVNLRCIQTMKREFDLPVGYSDHTLGTVASLAAAALGADIIEKHFTHDRHADGPDHMLSADHAEMKLIVDSVRLLEKALGDGVKRPGADELVTRINNRKSVVTTVEIPAGTAITAEMIAVKRPGTGIPPKCLDQVIGRTARVTVPAEEPLQWEHL